jgi:transcription antitermination factor NusG
MIQSKLWYAVYTRPRWEKKTSELLLQSQIETYCPLNKVVKRWADRKKIIHEPLFTSYCFVRVGQGDYSIVRKIPGVINFVYWLGKPAIIKDEEINLIKQFLSDYQDVRLESLSIAVNDRVKIIKGAFVEQEGAVIEVRARTVRIQLPTMGVVLIAEIAKNGVEVVSRHRGV